MQDLLTAERKQIKITLKDLRTQKFSLIGLLATSDDFDN